MLSVRDFGAHGDGIHDDGLAIQKAINALHRARGGAIYFSEGKYLVGRTIHLRRGIRLVGASRRSASLIAGRGVGAIVARDPASTSGEQDITIEHLGFRPLEPRSIAIDFTGITQSLISDVLVSTWLVDGSYQLRSDATIGVKLAAPDHLSGYGNVLRDLRIENVGTGILISADAHRQLIDNCDITWGRWGIRIDGRGTLGHVVIQNSRLEGIDDAAVLIDRAYSVHVVRNWIEFVPRAIEYREGTEMPLLEGNMIANVLSTSSVLPTGRPIGVLLVADKANVQPAGERLTWTAEILGDGVYEFEFALTSTAGEWRQLRPAAQDPKVTVTVPASGEHRIGVQARRPDDAEARLSASAPIIVRAVP